MTEVERLEVEGLEVRIAELEEQVGQLQREAQENYRYFQRQLRDVPAVSYNAGETYNFTTEQWVECDSFVVESPRPAFEELPESVRTIVAELQERPVRWLADMPKTCRHCGNVGVMYLSVGPRPCPAGCPRNEQAIQRNEDLLRSLAEVAEAADAAV